MTARTILYARVSTIDETVAGQLRQAEAAGFMIDEVVADDGASVTSMSLNERPNGRQLFDMLSAGDVLVVRWVDRLGRNYTDAADVVRELTERGIVIRTVINDMTFDGAAADVIRTAVRDALVLFMEATAQAQAEAMKAERRVGIDHTRTTAARYLGRKPSFTLQQLRTAQGFFRSGAPVAHIAWETGLSRQTVYRIRANPAAAEAALLAWNRGEPLDPDVMPVVKIWLDPETHPYARARAAKLADHDLTTSDPLPPEAADHIGEER